MVPSPVVSNVAVGACVTHHLLNGPETPLLLLPPAPGFFSLMARCSFQLTGRVGSGTGVESESAASQGAVEEEPGNHSLG